VDLYWAYNGPTKYNSGYTSIYRSTTAGSGISGTLIRREANLYSYYTDTTADDYTTQYYTFVHSVDGVGVYTYEKTVASKVHTLTVSINSNFSPGETLTLSLQGNAWDGTTDTTYVPATELALSITKANTLSTTSVPSTGWVSGAKSMTLSITGTDYGADTITVSNATGESGTDTFTYRLVYFLDTLPYATGPLVGNGAWVTGTLPSPAPSLTVSGGKAYPTPDGSWRGNDVSGYNIGSGSFTFGCTYTLSVTLTKALKDYGTFGGILWVFNYLQGYVSHSAGQTTGSIFVGIPGGGSVSDTFSDTFSVSYAAEVRFVAPNQFSVYIDSVYVGDYTVAVTYPKIFYVSGYIEAPSASKPVIGITVASPYLYSV